MNVALTGPKRLDFTFGINYICASLLGTGLRSRGFHGRCFVVGGGARIPSQYRQGTLEQGTEA